MVETTRQSICERFPSADINIKAPSTARVHADKSLGVVFENLLENAVEHTEQEHPKVEVTIPRPDDQANWIEIQIVDNGPGIPDFETDAVTGGEERPLNHGSGIGLWTVKWLIDQYGGDVTFEEKTPHGSIVTLRLRRPSR